MFFMVERLKTVFKEKPPLIAFLFCLVIAAIGMFALARHVRVAQIKDPNEPKNWNNLLHKLTTNKSYWSMNGTLQNHTSLNKNMWNSSSTFQIQSYLQSSSQIKPKLPQDIVFESVFELPDNESLGLQIRHKLNHQNHQILKECKKGKCKQFLLMCVTVYGKKKDLPSTSFADTCANPPPPGGKYMTLQVTNMTSPFVNESMVMVTMNHATNERLDELLPMAEKVRIENRLMICGYLTTASLLLLLVVFALFAGSDDGGGSEKLRTPAHQPLTSS